MNTRSQRAPGTAQQGDDPQARRAWFLRSRSGADGKALREIYLAASRTRHRIERDNGKPEGTPGPAGAVNWTPLGPSVIKGGLIEAGRVTTIVVGPGGSRIYAGAANGGVWYSGNGGATWSPIDDYVVSPSLFGGAAEADSLAIGALAIAWGMSAIGDDLYVGTGDPNQSYDAYDGIGVRHLVGGVWSLEATNLAGHGIFNIVIDPDDATTVLAATTEGLYRRPASGSLSTWTRVSSPSFTNSSGAVSDLIVTGSGASKLYYAAFAADNVYTSPDTVTWTALSGLSGSGRLALAAGESDPTAVYALFEDATLNRLNGTAFSVVPGLPASALFPGQQGWYDVVVAVDPADGDTVYLGGDRIALFKGTVTGTPGNWTFPFNPANDSNPTVDPTWVGSGIHSDVHAFAFGLDAAGSAHDRSNVWVGCDGGLYQSTGSGAAGTFQPRNLGLAVTEFSYLAQRADTDAVAFAGAQDNGTPRLLSEQASLETAGGDGGGVTYNPTSAYQVMRQYVGPYLYVSQDGGATWQYVSGGPSADEAGFVAPLAAVATGSSSALAAFGTTRLWVTTDWGGSWVTLPTGTDPNAASPANSTQDVIDGNAVTALAFASATLAFAATPFSIWQYTLTGSTWSSSAIPVTSLPASRYITALAPDPGTPGSFYVALGGGGEPHVYYYDGSAWEAAMPTTVVDVPTHAVVVDPDIPTNVYVGTDVGCWKGVRAGSTWSWSLFSQGLPESAVTDLAIHVPARLLRAATHGRGVWEMELDATVGLDPDVYLRANYNDTGRIVGGSRQPWVEGHPDPTHVDTADPYVLYHWMSADIKVRRSSLVGLPSLGSPVSFLDFAFNIGDYVDSVAHIETADTTGTDRIFVEVHNRSLNPVPAAQVNVLLLVANASAGLPALPAGYVAEINAGNTSTSWLGSNWHFVDPTTPYRTLSADLDVRTPQVVEYQFDFSTLGLSAGQDHVCLLAFVTTPGDPITATNTDLNQATMQDKHIAHRNTHLVAAGATPGTEPGGSMRHQPRTLIIDFHNATDAARTVDLVFDRTHFPGELSVMLPKLEEGASSVTFPGMEIVQHNALGNEVRRALGHYLERLGHDIEELGQRLEGDAFDDGDRVNVLTRLADLDRTRSFEAAHGVVKPTISGVTIPPHGSLTGAVTIEAPPSAAPGTDYRLDVVQYSNGLLVGGSTYVVAIVKS